MQSVRKFRVFPLAALMMVSSSAFAGLRHVVTPDQLAATVTAGVAKQDANRATVHEALARPAWGPSRTIGRKGFERAWGAAGFSYSRNPKTQSDRPEIAVTYCFPSTS